MCLPLHLNQEYFCCLNPLYYNKQLPSVNKGIFNYLIFKLQIYLPCPLLLKYFCKIATVRDGLSVFM